MAAIEIPSLPTLVSFLKWAIRGLLGAPLVVRVGGVEQALSVNTLSATTTVKSKFLLQGFSSMIG
jgi:hypothetical protein